MPSPTANRVRERGLNAHSMNEASSSSPSTPVTVDLLHGPDPSIHMLGLPKAYPQLGRWVALAILSGAIAAFLLVALANH
jgi:hypothetical protein